MEPDPRPRNTGKPHENPRKKATRGDTTFTTSSSSVYQPRSSITHGSLSQIASQPHSSGSVELSVCHTQEPYSKGKQQKGASSHSFDHPQQQPLSPAFMPPGSQDCGHEGKSWQPAESLRPGPSRSFTSPGLHAHGQLVPFHSSLASSEDVPTIPLYYGHHTAQVATKPVEDVHKKEKKPQKPGKYICKYCSRPCAKPSVLEKHIRSHTGERPYPCIPCGFSFKTKSNLYKHRKSHAHRIKAGLSMGSGGEMCSTALEVDRIGAEELEEPTEGESTDSDDEVVPCASEDLPSRQKYTPLYSSSVSMESQGSFQSTDSQSFEDNTRFLGPSLEHPAAIKSEDTHTIKQKLALQLSKRKKAIDEQAHSFLSPGSKGSTESGYFSRSESAEQPISSPASNAKSYAEIILGKCGRIGQKTTIVANVSQGLSESITEEKSSALTFPLPKTQVIEHITKLITINEAVVDTSEIDSVKPRRSSLSRRSSIESPKPVSIREQFQFDIKPSGCQPGIAYDQTKPSAYQGERATLEKTSPAHLAQSVTETAPLLRSHSMPSASSTMSSSSTFRVSHSFDDRFMESEEIFGRGQGYSSHPRMLKRQPAIELPVGMEYSSEATSSFSIDTAAASSFEQDSTESETAKRSKRGLKVKSLMYECNICSARYKKRDNYEAHKKYYCSELQASKYHSTSAHTQADTVQGFRHFDIQPHVMHYKLGPGLEPTPMRKRRKEKSLGDDDEPLSTDSPAAASSSAFHIRTASRPDSTPSFETTVTKPQEIIRLSAEKSEPMHVPDTDVAARIPSVIESSFTQGGVNESAERRATGKEISVIQHTSSFERSESVEQMSASDGEEKSPGHQSLQPAPQHFQPSHALQPRLVRQPNIQVPEILVTEEPDRPEQDPEPPVKEQEKSEEFQWPQRSQTLSQLPAEKLPPKKKRLRLAEMAQSSGESSFESASLTRSPSQESSTSHISSHSTSFEREEHGKSDTTEFIMKSVSSHMLTVPSHPSLKEMRRSASEQAPSASHAAEMSETRSKSFDYGSLSTSSSAVHSSLSTLKERRKCFLVRQASLSKYSEADPEPEPKIRQETEEQRVSSPGKCVTQSKSSSYSSPPSSHLEQQDDTDQQTSASQIGYKQSVSETLQTFKHHVPQTLPHDKQLMTSEFPLLSIQQQQQRTELAVELFPTQSSSNIFSAHLSLPHAAQTLPPTHQLPLPPALLQPVQSHITQQAWRHQTDVSFHQHPSFLHMQFPSCAPFPTATFLPLQPQLAVQLSTEEGVLFKDKLASCSPPSVESYAISTCSDFLTSSRLQSLSMSHTSSASVPLSISPRNSQPLVSFVVPVRIQTHMPSYGSAMYTSLSQILMSQPHGGPSTVVICKVEDNRPKGTLVCTAAVRDLDLAHMITQSHRGFFPNPYLTVPSPVQERKGFMSFTSPLESNIGVVDCPSIVGGSKRMLSPAGSLELTMESQQQKRVKEEDASKPEEEVELLQFASAEHLGSEEKAQTKPYLLKQSTVDLNPTSVTTSDEQSPPKEAVPPSQSLLQSVEALQSESLDEYKLKPGKPFRRKTSMEIKKEDSKDADEQPVHILSSSVVESPISWSLPTSKESIDKKTVLPVPSLHTTTNVSWCYLNYIKPNHTQQVDHRSSVYAGWCVSLYNPHLPGVSTKVALALLRSKQKLTRETYTMASASRPQTGKLVPSNSRNPKMTEVHLPSLPVGEERKDGSKVEKEEEKQGRQEEDNSTTKRGEPVRIKIFEGGYKSNEEYVYVRGRGRGKYVCEECGIRCKKPSMLKKHIRTHTDVRPYVCKYCNFAFKTKGNLTKHMKSKAHSKKCQEMGVSITALEELEAEEGTSDSRLVGSDDKEESELVEEHQFSDLEESEEDDDDSDDDEEEEEDESQEEQTLKSSETRHSAQQHYGVSSVHHTESSQHMPPSPEASTFGSHQLTYGYLMTSPSREASQSTESSEMARCSSSLLSHQRPVHSSSEQVAAAETEANARQQLLLGLEEPSSRDASPKRRWSPSLEAGSTKAALSRRHFLTKSEMSPKRFASGGDMSPLRCLSPRRGISPKRRLSPGREMSPLRCISPRQELSSSKHLSPRREFSPRTYLSPERGVSPVRPTSPSTEVSARYLPLRKMLSSSSSESPTRFHSPIKDMSPCSSLSAAEEKTPASSRDVSFGLQSVVGISHWAHQKYVDVYEPTQKTSESENIQEGPSTSTTGMLSVRLQKMPPLPEAHTHVASRLEDNIFSHLPLHSQQLARTPCPMIPIGGIQMVQARPSAHPSLVPVDTSLQTGYFMASSLTEVNLYSQRSKKLQVQLERLPSFEYPAAKVSKYSPLQQTFSPTTVGPALEKNRTSTFLEEDVEEKEYRVQTHAELGHSGPECDISRLDSPSTSYEYSSKPSTSREGLLEGTGKKQCSSLSTYFESSGTFISDFPARTLDRSSSTSCLVEPSLGHSLPRVDARRRRNFSGDPSHQLGAQTKGTQDPERADLGQTQRQKGEDAGSAFRSYQSSSPKT
ncbi:transcription factor HIVEP3 [Protopterus annectens]|uniref:transcription factor HIVEP3 n=1 Tax=Protopterus annectens TaxID=7888 RepID=UPI001CFB9C7D|nr:transcription factor HIVEP3 [Protopterus annectens]